MNMIQVSNTRKHHLAPEKTICNGYYLMEVSGLSESEIQALIDHALLTPIHISNDAGNSVRVGDTVHFALHAVLFTTNARRLRDDFELDCNGMILALNLLRRIDNLQEEMSALKACLPAGTFNSALS
ncbi:chaperone modulator CbpM [Undibacterium sp. Ji67W]|uniref:chaperone modulator CbpM n=1 Tax=Undibacterium sp. Ji67W TaxID=3413042 RepID=UPI003BF1F698